MSSYIIETEKLTKKFGKNIAVNEIDFKVPKNEIFGFLGPNGASKTTTIRMLCGILKSTSGNGKILGYDLNREAEIIKKNIGYMSQTFGLYPDLTVEENIRFYSSLYGGVKKFYQNLLIEKYGFSKFRKELANNLSGGYKQRLALICALTHKPSLLFLDEPTSGVDPITRKELWDLFYNLSREGTALFITTHYMEEAERCDRIGFIFQGKLIINDTPSNIKNSLTDADIFEIKISYEPKIVSEIEKLDGLITINQVGDTLKIISSKGKLNKNIISSISYKIKIDNIALVKPTIEDVFIKLTRTY